MSRAAFRSHVIQAMSLVREGTGHVSELVSQRTGGGWVWLWSLGYNRLGMGRGCLCGACTPRV